MDINLLLKILDPLPYELCLYVQKILRQHRLYKMRERFSVTHFIDSHLEHCSYLYWRSITGQGKIYRVTDPFGTLRLEFKAEDGSVIPIALNLD